MAIYHLSTKIIKRSAGHNAVAAAAYRSGQKLTDHEKGTVENYSNRNASIYSEIVAPENAPDWVYDREILWNKVEEAEKRKDAQLAREVVVALPRELPHVERADFMRDFCQAEFVDRGMVADFSIHEDKEDHNPHAHIMLTTRDIDEDGFGKKQRDWNQHALHSSWREAWASHVNQALERNNVQGRVDHRSYKARGIDKVPTVHLGKAGFRLKQTATRLVERRSKIGKPREMNYKKYDLGPRKKHNERIIARRQRKRTEKYHQKRSERVLDNKREYGPQVADKRLRGRFRHLYANPAKAETLFYQRANTYGLRAAYVTLEQQPEKYGELIRSPEVEKQAQMRKKVLKKVTLKHERDYDFER